MCGITGFWQPPGSDSTALAVVTQGMSQRLTHRGPDDSGEWVDSGAGVAFGFRRLAIVDLSPMGHQPMSSANGRYEIVFNGEVYNFAALREELATLGHTFRGGSDTEVILSAIAQWGLERAVSRFVGMFAIAIWDRKEGVLHLVRDRLGIKPLYYGWQNGVFLFGSELKALAAHPAFSGEIDRNALALYMRLAYVPDPYSIYCGIRKLPPGSILSLSSFRDEGAQPKHYWSVCDVMQRGRLDPFGGSDLEGAAELDRLLREAVALRMVADVPLGAFLSGGVDSSTVVSLMQAQSSQPVKTFTIGFAESSFDEAEHAAAVAAHLGTEHTEFIVTPSEARQIIPRLPTMFDEPFADSSQIPTFLVSELARKSVTVSLSGDGGDELFGGYNRYQWGNNVWMRTGWAPPAARRIGARVLKSVSPAAWDRGFVTLGSALPASFQQRTPGDKMHKLAEILAVESPLELYLGLVSQWGNPQDIVQRGAEPATVLTDQSLWSEVSSFPEQMMLLDMLTYLPGDILTKVDRASMATSLEARVPMLDHRVVEFAASLPVSMKIRDGKGKWVLRRVLDTYVPRTLIERPKMGFGVPIDSWLRGPLRDWAGDLLDPRAMRQQGFLHPEPIQQRWTEHLSGSRNWQASLWCVLQFQAWHSATLSAHENAPMVAGA